MGKNLDRVGLLLVFLILIGKYNFVDGRLYDGLWIKDMKHGKGSFKFTDDSVYNGTWNMDIRMDTSQCPGILKYKNGDIYEGA